MQWFGSSEPFGEEGKAVEGARKTFPQEDDGTEHADWT